GEIVIVTTPDPERLAHARAPGASVVAPQPILDWLSPDEGLTPPCTIDGVQIEMIPYAPASAGPVELLGKVQGIALKPATAARRLLARARSPRVAPQVTMLTFPSGERLVHLNLSIHSETPADWLADIQARAAGAQWLVLGVVLGQSDAVLQALPGFEARYVLFTDFVSDTSRGLGRPVELLTPTADQAVAMGVEGHVCVSQASYRFE
ncbi:MAG: hypothetical protein ACI8S6_004909, partial [Myxococcota bacterium]